MKSTQNNGVMMKHFYCGLFLVFTIVLMPAFVFGQTDDAEKYALVIGNGNYTGLSRLANPVNDADDVAQTLAGLGFSVEKVLNGSLEQMEDAVTRLRNLLSGSAGSYGFFFYAGHGVQSGGENYLIPVDASIPNETYLRNRAVSVQTVLDDLNEAGNALNVVVLDACRDNPFGWSRSGSRGLAIVTRQPADSIIVYATSAGQQASDGHGRNGLFTSMLLPHLALGDMEVGEVFKRTGADVAEASGRQQVPAIYNQFFGTAYLGGVSADAASAYVPGSMVRPQPLPFVGKEDRTVKENAKLWTAGASIGSALSDPLLTATARGTIAPVNNLFFEIGAEFGVLSADRDIGYFHFFPHANAAYYLPLGKFGVYAGAGAGYLTGSYQFPEDKEPFNTFVFNVVAGGNIFNIIDISYTFRTSFKNIGHKVSIGYIYRFK